MDDTNSTSGSLERIVSAGDAGPLDGYTSDYVKRLLVERMYIYAKLHNPGGSVILRSSDIVDHDRPEGYSTQIGNTFHLDLIELEKALQELVDSGSISKKEVDSLLTWADGMNSREAAHYLQARGSVSVRKRRERALNKVQERLSDGRQADRGNSESDS